MSILINGMEMPENCYNCWLGHKCPKYEALLWNEVNKERKADCPLVPVPPHGRLIEDTAVREQIDEWLDSVGDVVVGHGLSYYGELLGCIKDAPTIIPAEEGE